jgi:hypothetical protein
VPATTTDFHTTVDALPGVERGEAGDYTWFSVMGKRFGYYWPRTRTVGVKQTLSEQEALVAERPEVFEVQFTMGGFGWVVVHLGGIDADELQELVYEAWRLSAPAELIETTAPPWVVTATGPRREPVRPTAPRSPAPGTR